MADLFELLFRQLGPDPAATIGRSLPGAGAIVRANEPQLPVGGIMEALQPPAAAEPPSSLRGRAPENIPAGAARAGNGPEQSPPRMSPFSETGPTINNAGTLSNSAGAFGFSPIGSVLGDRELASLGYAANADNSLRRTGTPFDQQLNLMTQLQRMAESSAPGINASDMATREQQSQARNQYLGNQMQQLMQSFGSQILPNQIAQDRLSLDRAIQFGANGIPGAIANAASDAENRKRENERYGPEARYDAFFNQAYNAFPPGTPHDARMRQLQQQGLLAPEFITGRAGGSPGATAARTTPRTAPAPDAAASAIDQAFANALSSFPTGPTGTRTVPTLQQDPAAVMNAITQTMGGLDNAALRNPEVRQRLINQYGTGALDQWLNTSNNLMNRFSMPGRQQQEQIRRYLGLAGMQQERITPFTGGASTQERLRALNPLLLLANFIPAQ